MEIIPAILPKNFEEMRDKLSMAKEFASFAQIDICDGIYIKSKTWPYGPMDKESLDDILNEREGFPFWQEIDFELDLMVKNASGEFDNFLRLGPKRLVFHLEAEGENFAEFLEGIDPYVRDNTEIGVAINPATPIEKLFPLIPSIDFVQCMGIDHEGAQGEEFDDTVLEKIKSLREKYEDLKISVDGGVSLSNAYKLFSAGANRLVVGSAIWRSVDPIGSYQALKNEARE